jgi:hypothetical protein
MEKTAAAIKAAIAELDTELAHISYCLDLARECGFSEIAAALCADCEANFLPALVVLLCVATGAQRKALGKRYRRLRAMVSN